MTDDLILNLSLDTATVYFHEDLSVRKKARGPANSDAVPLVKISTGNDEDLHTYRSKSNQRNC